MPPSTPRLSVVTFTNGPAPLVAASLRRIRRVAHEIVVAVDERTDPDTLGPVRGVADRVLRAEFAYPLEANLGWLHDQATGDWVLRIDGDEVPSDALIRLLDTPGWDEGITHAYLQYRWIYGSPDRMLDQAPWRPDPVLRLIRRTPGIARFPTGVHDTPEVAGESRSLDVALYHLDLVLTDEETRRRKVDGYQRRSPGHRTDRGWAHSSTYFLPERSTERLRTAPVPPVDEAAIEAVIEATEVTARPGGGGPGPTALGGGARPGGGGPGPPGLGGGARHVEPVIRVVDRRQPPPAPATSRVRILDRD